MLAYVMDAASDATAKPRWLSTRRRPPRSARSSPTRPNFALQEEPRGTGDALRAALAALPSGRIQRSSCSPVTHRLSSRRRSAPSPSYGRRHDVQLPGCSRAMQVDDPTGYGRLVVKKGRVTRIVEEEGRHRQTARIDLVNTGLYAFDVAWLRERHHQAEPSKVTGEIYLTDLVELAHDDQRDAVVPADHDLEWAAGRHQRPCRPGRRRAAIQADTPKRHMLAGVTIRRSASRCIDATVEIGPTWSSIPTWILRGATYIGRDTVIRAGSQIVDSTIGEGCQIWSS